MPPPDAARGTALVTGASSGIGERFARGLRVTERKYRPGR